MIAEACGVSEGTASQVRRLARSVGRWAYVDGKRGAPPDRVKPIGPSRLTGFDWSEIPWMGSASSSATSAARPSAGQGVPARAGPPEDVDVPGRPVSQWMYRRVLRTRGPSATTIGRSHSVGVNPMSTLASMPTQPAGPIRIPWPLYRMTLEQYESLIATGFFPEHDDVHLINGYVVNRMAESPLHGAVCEAIRLAIGASSWPWPAGIPAARRGSDPPRSASRAPTSPSCAAMPRDYLARYPDAADVAMVAEVSISSLDEDRAKADIYAAGGIPVYWIVNVDDGQVEVYSNPGPSGYQSHEVLRPAMCCRSSSTAS